MKQFYLLLLSIVFVTSAFAQKKEKIKGSKTVTVTQKEVESFESLEIEDNIEVYLVKGSVQSLEIEADDNLHDVIAAEMYGSTLRIYTTKEVTGQKQLTVKITYTDNLKTITAKHEAVLNAISDLELADVIVKNLDYSKSYLNVKSGNFSLIMNDKSKAELNLRAEKSLLELSKNADLKALIASPVVQIDMYQKSNAVIEGDTGYLKLRLDNNATYSGRKFTAKDMELVAEGYTTCSIMAAETLSIFAAGKSEIQLLGTPKIDMKNFGDSAVIYKKIQ